MFVSCCAWFPAPVPETRASLFRFTGRLVQDLMMTLIFVWVHVAHARLPAQCVARYNSQLTRPQLGRTAVVLYGALQDNIRTHQDNIITKYAYLVVNHCCFNLLSTYSVFHIHISELIPCFIFATELR